MKRLLVSECLSDFIDGESGTAAGVLLSPPPLSSCFHLHLKRRKRSGRKRRGASGQDLVLKENQDSDVPNHHF